MLRPDVDKKRLKELKQKTSQSFEKVRNSIVNDVLAKHQPRIREEGLVPKTTEITYSPTYLSQDNRTPKQIEQDIKRTEKINNAKIRPAQAFLGYLSDPSRVLGDMVEPLVGTPFATRNPFNTSKELATELEMNRQYANGFSDLIRGTLDIAGRELPSAVVNTALGAIFAPSASLESILAETILPFGDIRTPTFKGKNIYEDSIDSAFQSFSKEAGQQAPVPRYVKEEQVLGNLRNNVKGLPETVSSNRNLQNYSQGDLIHRSKSFLGFEDGKLVWNPRVADLIKKVRRVSPPNESRSNSRVSKSAPNQDLIDRFGTHISIKKPSPFKMFLSKAKNAVQSSEKIMDEALGELFYGEAIREGIRQGNKWFSEWKNHPEFYKRFDDLQDQSIDIRNRPEENFYKDFLKNTEVKTDVYPFSQQLQDMRDRVPHIHRGNIGVSYSHNKDIVWEDFDKDKRFENAWISRSMRNWSFLKGRGVPVTDATASTVIHENSHELIKREILENTELIDFILKNTVQPHTKSIGNELTKLSPKEVKHFMYLSEPTEVYARIFEIRKAVGLKPGEKVSLEQASDIFEKLGKDKGIPKIDHRFKKVLHNPKNLKNLLNTLPAVLPAIGAGAASFLQEPAENSNNNFALGGFVPKTKYTEKTLQPNTLSARSFNTKVEYQEYRKSLFKNHRNG